MTSIRHAAIRLLLGLLGASGPAAGASPSPSMSARVPSVQGQPGSLLSSSGASAAPRYSVIFVNNSVNVVNVCLFQDDPNLGMAQASRLAWLVKRSAPGTEALFQWEEKLYFIWTETMMPSPGARLSASQRVEANPFSSNQITLDYRGVYSFIQQRRGSEAGRLFIDTTGDIPLNMAFVGIGMAGMGTYVVPAQPNLLLTFNPHPVYWITFGNYALGQILDVSRLANKKRIEFPPGIVTMMAILGQDNLWTIKPIPEELPDSAGASQP